MVDCLDLGVSSVVGALVSEGLKLLIKEVKKLKAFDSVSKELESTTESLLSIITQIENVGELMALKDIIDEAREMVRKCLSVHKWNMIKKSKYSTKMEDINRRMLKFCQVQLQVLLYRNQSQSMLPIEAINKYLQIIEKKLDRLSVSPPVNRYLCSVPKLDKVYVGLDCPLMGLKKKLLTDSVDSLVVTAPPGCGKTTLVIQLCDDEEIKRKFKHIFFMVVSSAPSFRVLVQNLVEHNGYGALTFENDFQAGDGLRDLMEILSEDGPILLVLDDVWLGAEFLLQKFRFKLPGYKILVTSRFEFPSFGSTYPLETLSDKDARALLLQWASPPDHTYPDEFEDLLQKILKHCKGIPLVIEVIGVSLKGKALHLWKGQVESWSEGETIIDNPSVLERLQPSLNALNSNLKECFLDMGSFLEDQKIPASVIIDIWMELYGKGSSSSMKYLDDLASQNLLKLVPLGRKEHEDGFYNELLVTQHDILRELAIWQNELTAVHERKRLNLKIQEDNYPDWCLNPIKARLLSISTDDLFSSNWVEMDCPNVEALVLHISSSEYALPSFVAGMKKLKVLTIINHGSKQAILTSFSCLSSLRNLKRIRLENVSISLLDIPRLQLGSLKKLSLAMCSFGEIFYDTEEIDVSEALSSLQEIDMHYCYDLDELPYWVPEVVSLKTLSITNCHKLSLLPDTLGNLGHLEVLRLCSCINLSELPETTERLSNLGFLDISDCLGLRKLPQEIGKLQSLKKISMWKCSGCELPDSLRNIENLVVRCDEETGFSWKRLEPKMINLRVHEEEPEYNLNLLKCFFKW